MTDELEQSKPNNNPGYKSRAVLQAELDAERAKNEGILARLAALEAKPATAPVDAGIAAQLAQAMAELERLKKPQPAPTNVTKPTLYTGWVQAKEDCFYAGAYRNGPLNMGKGDVFQRNHPNGDVFQVEEIALWSDNPFVPVKVRYSDMNEMIVEGNEQPHADFRFRISGNQDTQIAPLRASSF